MPRKDKIVSAESVTNCYHCGEKCQDEAIHHDGKDFCCTGCQLVYDVLSDNNLCNYYELADSPGASRKGKSSRDDRFDYLNDRDVVQKLVDFKNEDESHVSFFIPLIHCASCIWLLENLPRLHVGILSSRVDFLKKKVQIKFRHEKISLRDLVLLLSQIGYEPTINLSDIDKKALRATDRRLVYKLAVAGFCFGNMMFFSLPEYFAEAELLGDGFKELFNYLNVLLALPVFFYSASDYYRSAWYALVNNRINMDVPIVLGIFALFFYSLYEIFFLGNEGYMDTLGGLLFFLLLGKLYQQKTYDTLSFDRDYKSYFPIAVSRLKGSREEVIPLTKLGVGDRIRVRNEELVPADSILIEGNAHIDYSFVTGEEVPVARKSGELIYAGGRQKGEAITLTVQKAPSQGYLTDLWNSKSFAKEKDHSLETLANAISGKFTVVILLIAFASLVYWGIDDLSFGIKAFTSVLIIACPCALAMSTPFTLGNTLRIFGAGKLFLKNAQVVERLAKVDTVVFDKTGTLTDPARASISYTGEELSTETKSVVKALVNRSIHPLSNRINSWLEGVDEAGVDQVEEIKGKGLRGLYASQEFRLGSAAFCGVQPVGYTRGNQVFLTVEGTLLGYFAIQSGLRGGIDETVSEIGAKMEVHFLSGDHGHERENLRRIFGDEIVMNFEQSPADKLAYIRDLEANNKKTLMVGDGLNDAGALRESHVGIALTAKATGFTPASDAIMDADVVTKLPQYLDFAKRSRNIVKASFGLSFAYNVVGVTFAVQGLVSPVFCAILMPMSSISVVVFTTVATNYLAFRKGIKKSIF